MMLFKKKGFTMIELMIAVLVLSVSLLGLLGLFIFVLNLNKMAGDMHIAVSEIQSKFEEIRNSDFGDITVDYVSGDTFSLTGVSGSGVIYIDDSNAERLKVKIVASYTTAIRRTIGGEDTTGDGELDSPVWLESYIAKR